VDFLKKRIETLRQNVQEIGYNHLVGKVAFNSTDFPVVTGFHCLMTVMSLQHQEEIRRPC